MGLGQGGEGEIRTVVQVHILCSYRGRETCFTPTRVFTHVNLLSFFSNSYSFLSFLLLVPSGLSFLILILFFLSYY